MKTIAKLFALLLIVSLSQIKLTGAYMWDEEVSSGNTISVGTWETEPPPPQSPDVVINEVMWMGSSIDSKDEWIELRNMTDHNINIGKWTIDNAKKSHGTYQLPDNQILPANGYFLIANHPKTATPTALNVDPDVTNANLSLSDSGNGNLILKDTDGNVIDQAKGDTWPAGVNNTASDPGPDLKQSMERNDIPGDGLDPNNWHTCTDAVCNDTTYWDTEGSNYGTPGGENHSENDSSQQPAPGPEPSLAPSPSPTPTASPEPSPLTTPEPTAEVAIPTNSPETSPTSSSTPSPTPEPSSQPTTEPSPSPEPSIEPTPPSAGGTNETP